MAINPKHLLVLTPLLLTACTTLPSGPSVMVLPGSGKSMEQFQSDDAYCKQFALTQAGTDAEQTSVNNGVKSAALATAIGAAAGALFDHGHARGAAVGAGAGLLFGSLTGAGAADTTAYNAQSRYDNAYQQCMFAKGNRIPSSATFRQTEDFSSQQQSPRSYTPPPNITTPPPQRYIIQ